MITNQTVKARYAGNGINRRWGIPFQYTDVNQICITVVENETERVLDPSEFTVSTETGAVTYPKSADDPALKTGATLVVYRSTNVTQESDLTNQGGAWPETIEAGLDKLTAIAQEHKEHLGRAILTTIGSNKTAEEYIKLLKDYTIDASNSAAQAGQTLQDVIANKEASSANADRAEYYANTAIEQAEAVKIAAIPITEHNTASDAHADIRQAIEDIDVSQDIQKHNTDSTAHADKFTQYLPLTGGNITGALSLNDKFVAVSVNGQKADAEGNIDMSGSEGTQLYTSAGSYTWTVPDGISKVLVTASAGGGGGGYGCRTSSRDGYFEYGGYGGRGANCYKYEIAVTAGEEISIVIGNGGGPASAGGATSFGDKLILSGGGAGGNSSGEGHPGASAGASSPQSAFTSCPYSAYGAGGNRGGSGGTTDISPGAGTRGMMLLEWSWLS